MDLAGTACEIRTAQTEAIPRDARAALRLTFQECAERLYRYILVRTGGNRDFADDLLQQTCYEAARHNRPPVKLNDIEAWLHGIARNLIRRHWRRTRRQSAVVSLDAAVVATRLADDMEHRPLPLDALIREEVFRCLSAAILELPAEDQELILEFYFDGRSQAEIASCRGLSERSIESRLYRARSRLRKALRHLGRSGDS